MSSSPSTGRPPAHRALFISLINDASLFPPAALEMGTALTDHATHRSGPDADLVGPFLVGVSSVDVFVAALDAGSPAPATIGLIARPGTPVGDVKAALSVLRGESRTRLVSIDAAWSRGWRDLDPGDLPIHLEVGREDRDTALMDMASASDFADVRAKFRTGATSSWTWPDAAELADFIIAAGRHHLPFVLTGGLHHVVRGEQTLGDAVEQQHGLLNVLVAVHARAGGSDVQTVRELLEIRDAEALAQIVRGWSVSDVAVVRAALAGYGCCDVTDPIAQLRSLDLLAPNGA